jgi:hypothetical protein
MAQKTEMLAQRVSGYANFFTIKRGSQLHHGLENLSSDLPARNWPSVPAAAKLLRWKTMIRVEAALRV